MFLSDIAADIADFVKAIVRPVKDIHDDIRDAHTEYSKKKFYHSITKSILAQQSRSPSFFSFIQRAAHNAWYHLARLEALHQAPHVSRELIMREMSIPSLASNPFAIGATAIGAAVGTLAVCKTCRVKTCGWCTRLFHFSARLGRKVRQDIVSIVEYISRITPNIHIATPSLLRGYIPFTESVAFLSNIKLPRIALPSIRLPKISLQQLEIPNFALPRFTLPRLQFSKLIIPSFSLPTIQLPHLSFPKLRQVFKNYYHSFSRNEAIQPIHTQRIGGGLGYFFKYRLPRKVSKWKRHYVIEFVVLVIVLGTVGVFMSIYADTTSNRGNMPIVYQGRLMDASYIPKSDSTYYLAFEIYTASSGGTCKWRTETTQDGSCAGSDLTALSATTSRGLFTVTLGAGAADNPTFGFNFDATASYLQVYVCPSATPNTTGSCETLTPRKQIGGVTYSYNSDLLDGLNYTDFLQLSPTTSVQTLAFTGVATDAVTITGNSLTTGKALVLSSSSLTSGILMDLQVSGTAAAASQTALNILTTGATATNAITTYGAQISNTHTNATSGTNVALYLNASGATTANYGLIVNAGSVGIGRPDPLTPLEVNEAHGVASGTTPQGGLIISNRANTSGLLDFGIDATGTFYSWIQSRDSSSATYYNLALNPISGNVGIQTTGPDGLFQLLDTAHTSVNTTYTSAFFGTMATMFRATASDSYLLGNIYYNTTPNWIYASDGGGALIGFNATGAGNITFNTSPTGTAGNTATLTERMTILQGGNVGIGIASPADDITGAPGGAADRILDIRDTTAGGTAALQLYSYESSDNNRIKLFVTDATSYGFWQSYSTSGIPFVIGSLSTELFRIDAAGNVGIGITSTTSKLDIKGVTGTTNASLRIEHPANTNNLFDITESSGNAYLRMYRSGAQQGIQLATGTLDSYIGGEGGKLGIGMTTPSAQLDITQATVGNQVLGLTSTATNDDPNYKVYQGRAATTDDTLTTINTIALTANNTYIVEARIIGRTTSGNGVGCSADNGAGYVVRGTYKQVGGTASLIGSVNADYTAESDSTWAATLNVSSGNVLVQVTGSVATCNITWHSTVFVSNVGS